MPRTKPKVDEPQKTALRPALTQEAQEDRCISLAYSLVEKRLLEGTASSQETTHFLRLGAIKAKKEIELLEENIKLAKAKTEQLQAAKESEKLYAEALAAFKEYRGVEDSDDEEEY